MSQHEKILVYLLRRDLRLADNPIIHEITKLQQQADSPFTHVLPLHAFAADQIEVSGFLSPDAERSPYNEARSQVGGFWRCGQLRSKFIAECIWDLNTDLKSVGSGLEIRVGLIKDVIASVLDGYKGREDAEIYGLWMTSEEGWEEKEDEKNLGNLLKQEGKEFRSWTDEKYLIDE